MGSFAESMDVYRKQIEKGAVQEAYQGLMEYFRELRSHFAAKYPEYDVMGTVYYGYMDMTYFALFPESLKRRKLKISLVFVHDQFRFEVWLSGFNRKVQQEYAELIADSGWTKYRLTPDPKRTDYVVDHVLIDRPQFDDLDALTSQIETGTLKFIGEVEAFLSKQG